MMALSNNSLRVAHTHSMRHRWQNARECSKKSVQLCPEQSRREGRNRFDARSVHCVRERERREERQVCEPEGRQHVENAAGGFFQHSHDGFHSALEFSLQGLTRSHIPHIPIQFFNPLLRK